MSLMGPYQSCHELLHYMMQQRGSSEHRIYVHSNHCQKKHIQNQTTSYQLYLFIYFLNKFIYLFIFGCVGSSPLCVGSSLWWLLLLRSTGFSSCGTRAQLLRGTWDLPGPGLEPMSPALAGEFPTTAPPGKPLPALLSPTESRPSSSLPGLRLSPPSAVQSPFLPLQSVPRIADRTNLKKKKKIKGHRSPAYIFQGLLIILWTESEFLL